MKDLIIIGARGWGREVLNAFRSNYSDEYHIKGFLDDNTKALDGLKGDFPPILSSVEDYEIQENDVFFCALGEPKYRKKYADIILAKGGEFITYISPLARVNSNSTIGKGAFIGAYSFISDNVEVGDFTMILDSCVLGHDAKIGRNVSIEAFCFFGGYSSVGDDSTIHVRSTIIRHKSVGKDSSVGACSLVIRHVKDNTNVFGSPATRI